MVDIHCHILPGIDDGPGSWETTLKMCEVARNDGITHVVATPHCNDRYRYNREAFESMLHDLTQQVPGMTFNLGCDFHLSYENIKDARLHPKRYTIGNTMYLLVEFTEYGLAERMSSVLTDLLSDGLVPIITHPERNRRLSTQFSLLEDWVSRGCLVQITAGSLTGFWGGETKRVTQKLLKEGLVHVIATDAHDLKHRVPLLSGARRAASKIVGDEYSRALVSDIPAAIIRGDAL